jgi:DNA repair protein RadC
MVIPRQVVKKLKSLNYRLKLAQDIPKLEQDIIELCDEYETNTLCGYRIYIEGERVTNVEKMPNNFKQLEMSFVTSKADKLEDRVRNFTIKKKQSYFDGSYHGCSVRIKMRRNHYTHYKPRYLNSPADVYQFLKELGNEDRERFLAVFLDIKNAVTGVEEVSTGTVSCSLVHPREIFKAAILSNPQGIILAHNHPSGDPKPSSEDINLTKRLIKASKLLGIDILDHVIIGYNQYKSLKQDGVVTF